MEPLNNAGTRLGPIVFWPFCPLLRGCPLLEVNNILDYRKVSIWYIEPCPLFRGYFYCVLFGGSTV